MKRARAITTLRHVAAAAMTACMLTPTQSRADDAALPPLPVRKPDRTPCDNLDNAVMATLLERWRLAYTLGQAMVYVAPHQSRDYLNDFAATGNSIDSFIKRADLPKDSSLLDAYRLAKKAEPLSPQELERLWRGKEEAFAITQSCFKTHKPGPTLFHIINQPEVLETLLLKEQGRTSIEETSNLRNRHLLVQEFSTHFTHEWYGRPRWTIDTNQHAQLPEAESR